MNQLAALSQTCLLIGLNLLSVSAQSQDGAPKHVSEMPSVSAPSTLLDGHIFEFTTTDGQFKPTGQVRFQTVSLRNADAVTHATVRHVVTDLTGTPRATYELPADFKQAAPIGLDLRTFINGPLLAALHLEELTVLENVGAELPAAGAPPNQGLAPAHITMVSAEGAPLRSVTLRLIGRYLTGPETVATPAGIFLCQRVSQTLEIERFDAGTQKRSVLRLETWLMPTLGLVRAETFAGTVCFDTMALTNIGRTAPLGSSVRAAPTAVGAER